MFFQFSYRGKRIYGISGKTANTLCYDKIDFSVQSIFYHLIKTISVLCICCGNSLVCIDLYKLPFAVFFDIFGVVIHLCSIGSLLFFLFRRNSRISCNPAFYDYIIWQMRQGIDCSCHFLLLSPVAFFISGFQLSERERSFQFAEI